MGCDELWGDMNRGWLLLLVLTSCYARAALFIQLVFAEPEYGMSAPWHDALL